MSFGPKQITFQDIGLNSLWAFIAWLVGSIIIMIIVFGTSSLVDIPGTFEQARLGTATNGMFPFVLSFITFVATTSSIMLTSFILNLTNPERYKKNGIVYWQIAFFGILTYIFITPIYIYTGLLAYDNILFIFIFHCILLAFGTSIILEVLNNYRYILTGIYGSFVGLFLTSVITLLIFNSFTEGTAKLISLLILFPIINAAIVFFKQLFEFGYYKYNKMTNLDQLWDIFYQIEQEEKRALREEEEKNSL